MNSKALVSVCMITYNHAPFIAQALNGILNPKTTFPIEIVIGEDCSTDDSRQVCVEYRDKFPDVIKLVLPEENIGMQQNFLNTVKVCQGKYVAICDGDDYWINPLKLQKQVDFLTRANDPKMFFDKIIQPYKGELEL